MRSSKSTLLKLSMLLLVLAFAYLAWWSLPVGADRLSFFVTIKLGIEVTALCLFLGAPAVYAAFRQPEWPRLPYVLTVASLGSLLVPTIARSLALSSMFSYYGPLATELRNLGLWSQGQPLDSSHAAVVVALVTLYLPFVVLILVGSMQSIGRLPDLASTCGANKFQAFVRVILPRLLRPLATAGLVVFSQVLGVIITPRILGSGDVTIAVLIDDYLKRTMNVDAALKLAWGEMALAIPIAVIAAYIIEKDLTSRSRPLQPSLKFRGGRVIGLVPVAVLVLVPFVLLGLSLGRSPILDLMSLFRSGPTLQWYGKAITDSAFHRVAIPSLAVWVSAAVLSILPATIASVFLLPHLALRRLTRGLALVLLFIPQNALGVLLFMLLKGLPGIQSFVPGWLLGAFGQAIPGVAFAFLLMDRLADRLLRSLKLAESMGASAWQRLVRIALPSLLPSLIAALVATALITLDDIIFVRYLPRLPVNTFATDFFGRARYNATPDLAAACILLALFILVLVGAGLLAREIPRIRRKLVSRSGALSIVPTAPSVDLGSTM